MRRIAKIVGALALITVVLMVTFPHLLLLPFTLAFGWAKSAQRFVSLVRISPSTLLTGLLIVTVLLGGTHWFCDWVQRTRPGQPRLWRWQWTCALYAGVVLVLLASAGLVGIAHQTAWMATSGEPMFKQRFRGLLREKAHLHATGRDVFELAHKNQWDFTKLRQQLPELTLSWEEFAFYFIDVTNGLPNGVILFPRDPKYRTEIGVIQREMFQTRPFQDLPELLSSAPR